MSRVRRVNLNSVIDNAEHFICLGACCVLEEVIKQVKAADIPEDAKQQVVNILYRRLVEVSEEYKATEIRA